MLEAFRLVYRAAIRKQVEREIAINESKHVTAENLMRERDGLINAMVAIANAATDPFDKRFLEPYNTFDKSWDFVFANAGSPSVKATFCTSDDPTNHQGDTCPVHEAV